MIKQPVIQTVDERDGRRLLRRIERDGGVDIIVMMRDSERTPQELAENLLLNEVIVTTSLDAYGGAKDRVKRLIVAIEQAAGYLEGTNPSETPAAKSEELLAAAQKKHAERKTPSKKPRVRRVHVAPTLAEVVPQLDDQHIVLEELGRYLDQNVTLRDQVMGAFSDSKAADILLLRAGRGFDAKVKSLLAAPEKYQELLAEAGASLRRDVRKYDTAEDSSTVSEAAAEQSPEATARFRSLLDAWEARGQTAPPDADDAEAEEQRERFLYQEEVLRNYKEPAERPS